MSYTGAPVVSAGTAVLQLLAATQASGVPVTTAEVSWPEEIGVMATMGLWSVSEESRRIPLGAM